MPTNDDLAAWCAEYSPLSFDPNVDPTGPSSTHADALGGTDDASHVVSQADAVGNGSATALSNGEQAKQDLPTNGTPPAQSPAFINSFSMAPTTGATTLLDMARISSGFNPLQPDDIRNPAAFQAYIKKVLTNPLFHLQLSDRETVTIRERDFNTLISSIADLFDAVSSEDKSKIKESLVRLAEAATSTRDTKQTKDLFVQNTVQINDGDIHVFIYFSTVSMEVHSGKVTTQQTDYSVSRARLLFQRDLWNIETATVVAEHHFKDLGDWLTGNSTKPGDAPDPMFALVAS